MNAEGTETIKLLDFGISKRIRGGKHMPGLQHGVIYGTPIYMAPEQARGLHEYVDERTDTWALGLIAYRLLCGVPYFDSESLPQVLLSVAIDAMPRPSQLVSQLPAGFDAWFLRACNRERATRFSSAITQMRALSSALREAKPRRSRWLSTSAAGRVAPSDVRHAAQGFGAVHSAATVAASALRSVGHARSRMWCNVVVASLAEMLSISCAPRLADAQADGSTLCHPVCAQERGVLMYAATVVHMYAAPWTVRDSLPCANGSYDPSS